MQRSTNLVKVQEKEELERQLFELREENELLKSQISNLVSRESLTQERDAVAFYLEHVAYSIRGIPSYSRIIREVLSELAVKIKNGEHYKIGNKQRRN